MTAAKAAPKSATKPVRRKHAPKAVEARQEAPETYCGTCMGHRSTWCPDCFGFFGCQTCHDTFKVLCPQCAGRTLEPIRW